MLQGQNSHGLRSVAQRLHFKDTYLALNGSGLTHSDVLTCLIENLPFPGIRVLFFCPLEQACRLLPLFRRGTLTTCKCFEVRIILDLVSQSGLCWRKNRGPSHSNKPFTWWVGHGSSVWWQGPCHLSPVQRKQWQGRPAYFTVCKATALFSTHFQKALLFHLSWLSTYCLTKLKSTEFESSSMVTWSPHITIAISHLELNKICTDRCYTQGTADPC